jgi:hypothetical protein
MAYAKVSFKGLATPSLTVGLPPVWFSALPAECY